MGILLSAFSYNIAIAEAPVPIQVIEVKDPITPKELAQQFARQYNVSFEEINKVIICESGWDKNSTGDHGLANGLAQFHEETFNRWSKQMGEDLDYKTNYGQLKLMSWAFSKGKNYKRAWSCWSKIYERTP